MTALITNQARAYVNFGRWVADCPQDCGSALVMQPHQPVYHCPECGHLCTVEWPADADELWAELSRRPAPRHRNWFPSGHVLALRAGQPHGQSVRDLADEFEAHRGT